MDNFPEIPILRLPDNFLLPAPILELPTAELPKIEPIFVPQTVQPGSLQDPELPPVEFPTLEDLLPVPQAEPSPEEESETTEELEEQKKDQTEETEEAASEEPDANTEILPTLPNLQLPLIQTTPIEEPLEVITDEFSFPAEEPEAEEPVKTEEIEGVTTVQVLGVPIPMPEPEILVAAGATATVSVAATLASTSILKQLTGAMKPLIKKIFNAVAKARGKEPRPTWARERLEQRRNKRH